MKPRYLHLSRVWADARGESRRPHNYLHTNVKRTHDSAPRINPLSPFVFFFLVFVWMFPTLLFPQSGRPCVYLEGTVFLRRPRTRCRPTRRGNKSEGGMSCSGGLMVVIMFNFELVWPL